VRLHPHDPLFVAYAFKSRRGTIQLALFNKDIRRERTLSLATTARSLFAMELTAPALDSTSGVRFAGAEVLGSGWSPQPERRIQQLRVAPASAQLITLGAQ